MFFDMEKAYVSTWRQSTLMDLNEAVIEGRMFYFIQNFLKPTSLKVNEIQSDTKIQTEGIPQGIVVSPKCLMLKMNKILAKLHGSSTHILS